MGHILRRAWGYTSVGEQSLQKLIPPGSDCLQLCLGEGLVVFQLDWRECVLVDRVVRGRNLGKEHLGVNAVVAAADRGGGWRGQGGRVVGYSTHL